MKLIKSRENPLIKEIRNLIEEKEKRKVFLLESRKLVEEALKSEVDIRFILITERFLRENRDFIEELKKFEILVVNEKIERSLSTLETPQGILAIAFYEKRELKPLKSDSVVLYLYKIKDPGNLGTIFRSAEALGVERVYLSPDSCSPFNTKVVRASAGSCLRVRFFENVKFDVLLKEIRENNGKIYSTSPRGGIPPWEIELRRICCLVIGSEPEGVPPDIYSLSDTTISIPQLGGESLNVAVSTSIILYEILKKRSGVIEAIF